MRYPFAKWAPIASNATQPSLRPTQVIYHSSTSTSIDSTWAYFNAGSGGQHTESHFIVGYDGTVLQCIDTDKTADAQWAGNAHAISIETASNPHASDSWAPAQAGALVALTQWALSAYPAIGKRVCRTWDDPGIGYHRLFQEWNQSNHSCPGDLRVKQFPLLLGQILAVPPPVVPPPVTHLERRVFLFIATLPATATLPAAPRAYFITDGVNQYRWIAAADLKAYQGAGYPTLPAPTYLGSMILAGPRPA